MNEFTITTTIPVPPQVAYDAWLDGGQHSEMTQSPATASTEISGTFSAHDGYITGVNLELEDGKRILQSWRTSQFEDSDPDSSIEMTFELVAEGTLLTLKHWNIPEGHAEGYESGWQDFYFDPMQEFFAQLAGD